jgi:hypothetical protein
MCATEEERVGELLSRRHGRTVEILAEKKSKKEIWFGGRKFALTSEGKLPVREQSFGKVGGAVAAPGAHQHKLVGRSKAAAPPQSKYRKRICKEKEDEETDFV